MTLAASRERELLAPFTLGFRRLQNPERSRTYRFPEGDDLTYTNVSAVAVRPSGNHRLVCDQGLVIVANNWIAIELDCDGWDF